MVLLMKGYRPNNHMMIISASKFGCEVDFSITLYVSTSIFGSAKKKGLAK